MRTTSSAVSENLVQKNQKFPLTLKTHKNFPKRSKALKISPNSHSRSLSRCSPSLSLSLPGALCSALFADCVQLSHPSLQIGTGFGLPSASPKSPKTGASLFKFSSLLYLFWFALFRHLLLDEVLQVRGDCEFLWVHLVNWVLFLSVWLPIRLKLVFFSSQKLLDWVILVC
jgi:hypothetical protein